MAERQWIQCTFCNGLVSYQIGEKTSRLGHSAPVCAKFVEAMNLPGVTYSLGEIDTETGEREEKSGVWKRPKS